MIDAPTALDTGSTQERTALPFKCTVQAPHSAMPHPNLVPVSPSVSRSTHKRGVSGSTSTERSWPLTVIVSATCQALYFLVAVPSTTNWPPAKSKLAFHLSPSGINEMTAGICMPCTSSTYLRSSLVPSLEMSVIS